MVGRAAMDGPASEGNPWLHRFSVFTAGSTLLLILAGGLVTSTGSGLAVPDWPLSYGTIFPPMVGGIFYEHGHRMVAAFVGLLTIVLTAWVWRQDPEGWVRYVSLAALGAVLLQGLLGGLTVLYLLPTPLSVAHALLGQTFFCLVVGIALFTSPAWRTSARPLLESRGFPLWKAALTTTVVIYVQLFLGAWMRHTEAGLAIPDFPLAFGRWIPPIWSLEADPHAPFPISTETLRLRVGLHFAHRVWALVVAASAVWVAVRVIRRHADRRELAYPAGIMLGLIPLQIAMGAMIVWTQKEIAVSTLHVGVGAAVLGSSLVLTLWSRRVSRREGAPAVQGREGPTVKAS
jgi:cytochrome c oxidase assembly protein subunit 15